MEVYAIMDVRHVTPLEIVISRTMVQLEPKGVGMGLII